MSDDPRGNSTAHVDLTPAERRLLTSFSVAEPPSDFAARTLLRVLREGGFESKEEALEPEGHLEQVAARPRGRRARALAGGISAILALAAGVTFGVLGEPSSGNISAAQTRQTVTMGERAVLVLEQGASLSWSLEARGHALVEQRAGSVFYRVDSGKRFIVNTPLGTVQVAGTCFRVEIQTMNTKKAAVGGGVGGALAASLVLVSVYEGRVITRAEGIDVAVAAGEVGELSPGARPRVFEGVDVARGVPKDDEPVPSSRSGELPKTAGDIEGARSLDLQPASPLALRTEVARLRERVRLLEQELTHVKDRSRDKATYDLAQEELERMAARCELRWDHPPTGIEPRVLDPGEISELALTSEQVAATHSVWKQIHEEMRTEISKIYTEATGDSNAGSLSVSAMINEIEDKTELPEKQRLYRQLSRERAGMEPPREVGMHQPPTERLLRYLTTVGDRTEANLAEKLGVDLAHAIRDLNGGWGSRSSSEYGCPN